MPDKKYHLGCGDEKLEGYCNVDLRKTSATDLVTDLSHPNLPDGITEVFSNAFYEHLYLKDRIPHLRSVYKSLASNGFINYMGLPWFPGIADAYLYGAPGTVRGSDRFDLYHAYRYTHGAPDEASEYLPQLHKGLFDWPTLDNIFYEADIEDYSIYLYAYPDEPHDVLVTCGFYAKKGPIGDTEIVDYLDKWRGKYINTSTISFQ